MKKQNQVDDTELATQAHIAQSKLADPDDAHGTMPPHDEPQMPLAPVAVPGPLPRGSPEWAVKEHERKLRHGSA